MVLRTCSSVAGAPLGNVLKRNSPSSLGGCFLRSGLACSWHSAQCKSKSSSPCCVEPQPEMSNTLPARKPWRRAANSRSSFHTVFAFRRMHGGRLRFPAKRRLQLGRRPFGSPVPGNRPARPNEHDVHAVRYLVVFLEILQAECVATRMSAGSAEAKSQWRTPRHGYRDRRGHTCEAPARCRISDRN